MTRCCCSRCRWRRGASCSSFLTQWMWQWIGTVFQQPGAGGGRRQFIGDLAAGQPVCGDFRVGANVVIAHLIGKGEKDRVKSAVHTALLLALISGVLMNVCGACDRPAASGADVHAGGCAGYGRFCICGSTVCPCRSACFMISGRPSCGVWGDTKRPLICLVTAGLLNAVLNLFFVIVLRPERIRRGDCHGDLQCGQRRADALFPVPYGGDCPCRPEGPAAE